MVAPSPRVTVMRAGDSGSRDGEAREGSPELAARLR